VSNGADIQPQMALRFSSELVPQAVYPEINPEKRISFVRLLQVVAATVPAGTEPRPADYFMASPSYIEQGLYIPPASPIYDSAVQTSRIKVDGEKATHKNMAGAGVVFPAEEYEIISRNVEGLALVAKRDAQSRLMQKLLSERLNYSALYLDIRPPGRTRYYARNMERKRAMADEKIHETIEVASLNLNLSEVALSGMHKAARKKLYNGNYSSTQFAENWLSFLVMIGRHNAAKTYKLQRTAEQTERELERYRLYSSAENRDESFQAA